MIVLLVDPHITLVELAIRVAGAVLSTVTAVSDAVQAPEPVPFVTVNVKTSGEEADAVMVADAELEVALLIVTPVAGLTVHKPVAAGEAFKVIVEVDALQIELVEVAVVVG